MSISLPVLAPPSPSVNVNLGNIRNELGVFCFGVKCLDILSYKQFMVIRFENGYGVLVQHTTRHTVTMDLVRFPNPASDTFESSNQSGKFYRRLCTTSNLLEFVNALNTVKDFELASDSHITTRSH